MIIPYVCGNFVIICSFPPISILNIDMAYLAAAKISPCEILDFKISSLAKIDLLKITLNSCGFKMYRFYSTLIECKNAFLVLLLILMNIFCHFKQKGHQSFKYRKFDGSVGKCC